MEVSAGDSGSKSESVFVAAPSSPGGRQHDALLREPGEGQNGLDVGLSRLHPVISSAALLNAACLFSLLVWDSYALRAVQILLIVGLLVLAISCVATSRRRLGDTAFLFKWIGWGLFVINGLVFLSWYGYAVYVAGVARSRAPGGELNYVQSMLQVSPHTSRFWFWVVLIDGCFSMLVGLMGLLTMLFRARRGGNRT